MKIGTIGTGFITDWVIGQMLEYKETSVNKVEDAKEARKVIRQCMQAYHEKYVDKK